MFLEESPKALLSCQSVPRAQLISLERAEDKKSKTTCRPLLIASLGIILRFAPQAHLPQSSEQENVERGHPSQLAETTAASEYKLTLYSGKALKTLLHFVIPSHRDS